MGTVDLGTADLPPGRYDVTLAGAGGEEVATNQLDVRSATADVEVTTDRATYGVGDDITVSWTHGPANRWDWIGVYRADAANPFRDDYLVWAYTGGHDAGALPPTTDGELVIGQDHMGGPWPLPPGDYVVHYLLTDRYRSAGSAPFSVRALGLQGLAAGAVEEDDADMDRAVLNSMPDAERMLVAETDRDAMAALDEDELLELHQRIRRARTKYVKNYRRAASAAVSARGGRGKSFPQNRRDRDRAEVFEEALARVSRRLGVVANESARELKAERLAAAKGGGAGPERATTRPRRHRARTARGRRARPPAASRRTRRPGRRARGARRSATPADVRGAGTLRPVVLRREVHGAVAHLGAPDQVRDQAVRLVDRVREGLEPAVGAARLERPLGRAHPLDERVVDLDRLAVERGRDLEAPALGLGPLAAVDGPAEEVAEQQERERAGHPAGHAEVDVADHHPDRDQRQADDAGQQAAARAEGHGRQGDREDEEHRVAVDRVADREPQREHAGEERGHDDEGQTGVGAEPQLVVRHRGRRRHDGRVAGALDVCIRRGCVNGRTEKGPKSRVTGARVRTSAGAS